MVSPFIIRHFSIGQFIILLRLSYVLHAILLYVPVSKACSVMCVSDGNTVHAAHVQHIEKHVGLDILNGHVHKISRSNKTWTWI